jgi:hypothetical protein
MLLLDSMHPDLYMFLCNIYISPLAALCLYSLLSNFRDFALSANAMTPDTLSSPLIVCVREDFSHAIAADLSNVGGYPNAFALD